MILFPERAGGRYLALRRPSPFVSTQASHGQAVGVKLSRSDDLPTAGVVVDGELRLYYGCCDSVIALATARLDDVVAAVAAHPV